MFARCLIKVGIDPRGFVALLRALILMDLREQHWAQATATKPHHSLSPLFLVVGQCVMASILLCALLFARVDVFFFALANLSLSLLLLGAAMLVEFGEIALNPLDRDVIGHLPVTPRTYAAARLANLLFYFALIYVALNVCPTIVGAGLRDAGWAFAPAYLAVSLGANLLLLGAIIVGLSFIDATRLSFLKFVLSWSQIVAVLVVVYGGQLVLRDGTSALQVWAAFPPEWIACFPVTWLARLVERAALDPSPALLGPVAGVCILGLAAGAVTMWRVERLCRRTYRAGLEAAVGRELPLAQLGGLSGWGSRWLSRGAEERAGFWLAISFLRRDGGLATRCLFAFSFAVVPAVVGILAGQFGNPLRESDPAQTVLPLLAFFALPLAAPALVYNLTYCRDSAGGWLLRAAPVARPWAVTRGACLAVLVWVATPLCVLLGVTAGLVWRDPLSAVLHAGLAWGLTWAALRLSPRLLPPMLPFSLPPARGAALRLPPPAVAIVGMALSTLAAAHALWGRSAWYWFVVFAGLAVGGTVAVLGDRSKAGRGDAS